MAGIEFDFSELNTFAADLGDAPAKIGPFVNSAIQFTSRNIRAAARKKVRRGDRSWRVAAVAITYDVTTFQGFGQSVIKSEIGYDKERRAGALGNLREYGAPDSPSGPLAPHYDLAASLDEEETDFIRGMEKATEDATQAVVDGSSFGRSVGTFLRGGTLGSS